MPDKHDLPGYTGLEIIAGFKFLQAATLILAGLGALGLMNGVVSEFAQEWLERWRDNPKVLERELGAGGG